MHRLDGTKTSSASSSKLQMASTQAGNSRTAESQTGRLGGMGGTCTHGLPQRSGSIAGGGRGCITPVTSSFSVMGRHPGRMAGTTPAAPFVSAVHAVVARVVTEMRSSAGKRNSSP